MKTTSMRVNVVPRLRALIETAATKLGASTDDHIIIEGADNQLLAKVSSATAEKMLAENMVLFPVSVAGNQYLVCIAVRR